MRFKKLPTIEAMNTIAWFATGKHWFSTEFQIDRIKTFWKDFL